MLVIASITTTRGGGSDAHGEQCRNVNMQGAMALMNAKEAFVVV